MKKSIQIDKKQNMYNFIKFNPRSKFITPDVKFRVRPIEKKTNKYLNNLNSSYDVHIIL